MAPVETHLKPSVWILCLPCDEIWPISDELLLPRAGVRLVAGDLVSIHNERKGLTNLSTIGEMSTSLSLQTSSRFHTQRSLLDLVRTPGYLLI